MARPHSRLEIAKDMKSEAHKLYERLKYFLHRILFQVHDGGADNLGPCIMEPMPGEIDVRICMEKGEVLDDEEMLMIFDFSEVDADYPFYKMIIQVTPKGRGCSVKWIVEYEKGHGGVADPHQYMDLYEKILEDMDAYIVAQA